MKTFLTLFLTLSLLACKKTNESNSHQSPIFSIIEENGKVYISTEMKNAAKIEKIAKLNLLKIDTVTQKNLALNYASALDREFYDFMRDATPKNSKIDSAQQREAQIAKIREKLSSYDTIKFRNYLASFYVEVINKNKTIQKDTIRILFDKSGYVADKMEILNSSRKEFR